MSSLYVTISLLKQCSLPEEQLRIFLSHLSQQSLKEYLSEANIYDGKGNKNKVKTNMNTHDVKLTQEEINILNSK